MTKSGTTRGKDLRCCDISSRINAVGITSSKTTDVMSTIMTSNNISSEQFINIYNYVYITYIYI